MSSEKPLHVRVAEALGCEPYQCDDENCCGVVGSWHCPSSCGKAHVDREEGVREWVTRYDTDWSAAGPLIERFRISLRSPHEPPYAGERMWEAFAWPPADPTHKAGDCQDEMVAGSSKGPLVAVCRLILALAEAGKLTETAQRAQT